MPDGVLINDPIYTCTMTANNFFESSGVIRHSPKSRKKEKRKKMRIIIPIRH